MIGHFKTGFLVLLAIIACTSLSAQHVIYRAGFLGFFDNREYFNEFVNDQTIFGTRVSGELGYAFNNNNKVLIGADYLYEFGSKGEWVAPDIVAYYHGQKKNLGLFLGAFPNHTKIAMPLSLRTDTFSYYRPITEGILIEYHTANLRHNVWIDWSGRQSMEKRETFLLGFSGHFSKGLFTWQHHFIMTHLAHSLDKSKEEHIRDNGGFMVLPGLDLSGLSKLDSLTIGAGILGSYDRIRAVYDFSFPIGFIGEIGAVYKGFGIHGTIYSGDSQIITSGDGFYGSSFYSRADVYYQETGSAIQGKLQFSFHFLPETVDLSMSLVIRARLDGMIGSRQFN